MTLKAFIEKYNGKTKGYPTDSQYKGECLSIVKLYVKEVFGISPPPSGSNSAYGYWSNFPNPLGTVFTKVKNTKAAIIKRGDIPVWNTNVGGGYGHIEICTRGGKDDFESFGQNWQGRHSHMTTHNFKNIAGWLKPMVYNEDEDMAENLIIKFLKEKGKYTEGDVREMYGAWQDIASVRKMLKTAETLLATAQNTVKDLEGKLATEREKGDKLAGSFLTANKALTKKTAELENETKLKNQYRRYWQDAKELSVERVLPSVLFRYWFKKVFNVPEKVQP